MVITDNLISYWKLDETGSSNASDSVGSNTLTNTNVTYTTGKINNGGVFNGSSAKLTNDDVFTITGTNNFTFAFWAKVDTYQNQNFFTYNIDGTNKIQIQPYSGIIYFQRGGTEINITGITDTTNWHHFTITYNGSTVTGYRDGVSVGSISNPASYTATDKRFSIGDNTVDSGYYDGNIDEFGYWSRALTADEVTTLYNSGNGLQYPFTGSLSTGNFFLII